MMSVVVHIIVKERSKLCRGYLPDSPTLFLDNTGFCLTRLSDMVAAELQQLFR
ncbi:hypothetical protein VCR3J2_80497 [Vibrio coralliirubri]|nr:hypothetical protein VCR3J2_80497 [Vibrio coralliirubri]